MAKRFMYVSIGILCLVAAYQRGTEKAAADGMTVTPGEIIGLTTNGASDEGFVYTSTGEAWAIRSHAIWSGAPWVDNYDLPVPASDVKFIDEGHDVMSLITESDEGWVPNGGTWVSVGPFPGGPISLEQKPWGSVKGAYRSE